MSTQSDRWDIVVEWVDKMASSPSFDEWERDYKISLSQRLVHIREEFMNGRPWLPELKRAILQKPLLPSWQEVDKFSVFAESNPETTREGLAVLWDYDASIEDRFSVFNTLLPDDSYFSTNLLSVLHMAMGAEEFPPFKPRAFGAAAKIIGYELPKRIARSDQAEIYRDALDFLDRIVEESGNRGVSLRDRLDAQGIVWTFGTKSDGFPDWSDEITRQYRQFCGYSPDTSETVEKEVRTAESPTREERNPSSPQVQKSLPEITREIQALGMRLDDRTVRRYHTALNSRGFVILAGISGTGKTWLAEAYASTIDAEFCRVAVAPNWTANEDLIGYFNPVDRTYHHTVTSNFIYQASAEYENAKSTNREARRFHLLLDEMNLARIEHYFATFLSAMEEMHRNGSATIPIQGDKDLLLTPNLALIGTVNIDETTHGFADKVFDRAQLIELKVEEDSVRKHMGKAPWSEPLMKIWRVVHTTAPFAYRVVDDISQYINQSEELGVVWQDSLDEQIEQKILPKLSGNNAALHGVLDELQSILADNFPLSSARVSVMQKQHDEIGFVSFFN